MEAKFGLRKEKRLRKLGGLRKKTNYSDYPAKNHGCRAQSPRRRASIQLPLAQIGLRH